MTLLLRREGLMFHKFFRLTPLLIPVVGFLSFFAARAFALNPEQLLIVANRNVPESMELARYYMEKRKVPLQNLIQLDTAKEEHISREVYDETIASPIRSFLKRNDPQGKRIGCIVLMYGVPLRIGPHKLIAVLENEVKPKGTSSTGASADSELALVMERQYKLEGWLPNRFFIGYRGKVIKNMPQRVLLVSRLDGPSAYVVRRIIDDSIQVEKEGLQGKAYFDARWPDKGEKKDQSHYEIYDRAIHRTAAIVEKGKKLPVVLDQQEKLFQPGEAPDAALYCGWYSLAKYVDAFTWAKGAVGYHVASSECTTLKAKDSTVWCKMMLEKGVDATVGPVAEPYLESFPQPEIFFGCLLDGQLALAECYALSNPFWSWQQVLIGDPLYRPFKHQPGSKE
jgi:uncharacterized protein (TIGR03790 family)